MNCRQRHLISAKYLLPLCVVLAGFCGCGTESGDPHEQALARLDTVRDRAISEIHQHLVDLKNTADSIADDKLMRDYFSSLSTTGNGDTKAGFLTPDQSRILNTHYVSRYGIFYDILFVERGGFVFHSIRQESDHRSNLFTGRLAKTNLARSLRADPLVGFIDFERYGPSGEAAAFFVVPVVESGEVTGWFVLQHGANTFTAMLADRSDLGRTGEVFLVNEDHFMLSDSRFINDTTVLEMFIDTEAVRNAFAEGKGHMVTRDYRGVQVLSSYGTFSFLNTTWGLFAEIDEDEVISTHFRKNAARMLDELVALATADIHLSPVQGVFLDPVENSFRVDMGELRRVDEGQTCWTPGVGPCTSVVAYYPGRFGYLTHLGPTDDVYIDDVLSRKFLGSQRTRTMAELSTRIRFFDVVPNELKNIRLVVVATHANSIAGILETLLEQGIDLAQIKFLYHPDADFANVHYSQASDTVVVEWVHYQTQGTTVYSRASAQSDLASLLRKGL